MILTKTKLKVLWLNNYRRLLKYAVVIIAFGVYYVFLGKYNLMERREQDRKMAKMEQEIDSIKSKIAQDKQLLQALQTDDETLETFAREQFYMKKENEDVFVIK
ncbi:MAG: septum formation initiator family protein [Prevotellaceae bacterium]|jgi:cell division protein FtsB|nr:septum formation initiator family protein [Prevotellaceae bacterium]